MWRNTVTGSEISPSKASWAPSVVSRITWRWPRTRSSLCDPEQALEYVERSGVDIFAPAIGTAHGLYRTDTPHIDFDRLDKISGLINGRGIRTPLVIHGGTGLRADVVKRLVASGGAKFNVSTDLKMTLIDTTFNYISEHREEYNPGRIDMAIRKAVVAKIEHWIDLLGSAGKA